MLSQPARAQTQTEQPENPATQALWDVKFSYTLTSSPLAGIAYFNDEFWISKWTTDTVLRLDSAGVLLNEFTIPGLTRVRSFTTDGTYMFASNTSDTIFRIDPATATLVPPHIIIQDTFLSVRWPTYDATLNSNAGGFWVGNLFSDIYAIDMAGNIVTNIPAAAHGLTTMYGAAIDHYTAGGPYLWVFTGSGSSQTTMHVLSMPSGATLETHDVFADIGPLHSLPYGFASGVFITDQYTSGEVTLMGVIQGQPFAVFGYEVQQPAVGIAADDVQPFSIFPNPAVHEVNICTNSSETKTITITITDMNGKVVKTISSAAQNITIDISGLPAGAYLLTVASGGNSSTQNFVKAE